ncbi:btk-binding protein-related [Anaeramoeba flamelloides]|uniref:Btk-binding protein-related n=1 Tax=Anaeramoeba flamelloides TaxID=1746091 RepID=A0AAV8A2R7_9EUKA|nr:btk-binding protein-related [Anaeramoeba flamelloides]|eukprot:Anaeramoba_flamelloidesa332355_62.p1 GENE.a332355_62~~a332355_62.p1  ORF type:complete len:583 (-),score=136.84 a332355_62:998-2746(-)
MSHKVFFSSSKTNYPKSKELENVWSKYEKIDKKTRVIKILNDYKRNTLIFKLKNGKQYFEFIPSSGIPKEYQIPNERIIDVRCSMYTYLMLTKSGKIYSLAKENQYGEIPLEDPNNSNFEKIRHCDFFEKNNLFVESFVMGTINNYFVCKGGVLYGNGYGGQGRLGLGSQGNKQLPTLLARDIKKAYCNPDAIGAMWATNDNKLFATGLNSQAFLSTGNFKDQMHPVELTELPFEVSNLQDLQMGRTTSFALTMDGKLYSCGSKDENGHLIDHSRFTEIEVLKNETIKEMSIGKEQFCLKTANNEFFMWGFGSNNSKWKTPTKVAMPNVYLNNPSVVVYCGFYESYLYHPYKVGSAQNDLKNLFQNKQATDCILPFEIKAHKALLEIRTGCKIEKIHKAFQQGLFSKEEINSFLEWVYFGEIKDSKGIQSIFNSLEMTIDINQFDTFEQDLLKLYQDEDSKDFIILVKIDDEDDDEDDEDDDEYEEIPVHKFILSARSGLFREMFKNLKNETNSVKDFSRKTIESLEILIKFFYTENIELTADDDPVLIVEELKDAIEYYQLSEDCDLNYELDKIKNQFNIL